MEQPNPFRGNNVFTIIVTTVTLFLIGYAYVFYQQSPVNNSHTNHMLAYAEGISGQWKIRPGTFWMSAQLMWIFNLSAPESLFWLTSLHAGLVIPVLIWVFYIATEKQIARSALILLALAVLFAAPIGIPLLHKKAYDFTLMHRSTFLLRNSTHIVLLPYAIISFALLVRFVETLIRSQIPQPKMFAWTTGLLLVATLIKPSFTLFAVPGAGLYALTHIRSRKQGLGIMVSLALVFIPAVATVAYFAYIEKLEPTIPWSPLAFVPFATWAWTSLNPFINLVLALAFPLWVTAWRWKTLAPATHIAWCSMCVAVVLYASFKLGDRDLQWPYLEAKFLLFVCCAIEWVTWLREHRASGRLMPEHMDPVHIAGVLLAAHALFGYVRFLVVDGRSMMDF